MDNEFARYLTSFLKTHEDDLIHCHFNDLFLDAELLEKLIKEFMDKLP